MVFLDTSAWIISFQKGTDINIKERIKNYIASNEVVISQIVILELLQGCRNREEKNSLQQSLESFSVLPIEQNGWNLAYNMGFNLRKKGLTIPTATILIAALVIENKCLLLHKDRHFSLIPDHYRELNEEYLD